MHRTFFRLRPLMVGISGFAMTLILATGSRAQDASGSSTSLSRYVPRDDAVLYLEYDGLDAHAEAWRKTAAYKILNNTPVGGMLEEIFGQLFAKIPTAKFTGPEGVALLKHLARSGFVFAMGGDVKRDKPEYVVFAFRDAFKNKEVRPLFARWMSNLNAPNTKPQSVVRAGHRVISGKTPKPDTFSWWVDDSKKEDIVLVFPSPESADFILETLDGKRPSVAEHPRRIELVKPENGFVPTGLFFLDPSALRTKDVPEGLGLSEVTKLDFRWGFQDDALMTIALIASPSPRKGVLALFDGPTFAKASLPPIPESVVGFTALSLDLEAAMEQSMALAKTFKPELEEKVSQFLEGMKAHTKLRLKEDILIHLGPKVACYVLPTKASASPAATGTNLLSKLMAAASLEQLPKLAVVFEIDDPVAFGKVLDEAMAAANREFKAQAPKPPGDAPQSKGARNRGSSAQTVEFRMMSGEHKMYVLTIPAELAGQFPASFRPAIRVGPKHAVVAVSADVARLALEGKGTWTPPNELGLAFQGFSSTMKFLAVYDPRNTLPDILAAFPAKLQSSINTALLLRANALNPAAVPPAAVGPGAVPSPEQNNSGANRRRGGPGSGPPGGPGAMPSIAGGIPGGPTPPGSPSTPGAPPSFVLQVDAAKMPSADSIKALLFPSLYVLEVNKDEIRFVAREAFPTFLDPSKVSAYSTAKALLLGETPPGIAPQAGGSPPAFAPPAGGSGPEAEQGRSRRGGGRGAPTARPD